MNILSAILSFIVICALIMLAIPVLSIGFGVLIAFAFCFIWFLPILLILGSDETSGGEKAAWILAIIFLSWFAWVFYFLLAPIKPKRRYYY